METNHLGFPLMDICYKHHKEAFYVSAGGNVRQPEGLVAPLDSMSAARSE